MLSLSLVVGAAIILSALQRGFVLAVHRGWFSQGFAGDACFHISVVRELKKGRYTGVPQFLIKDEPDAYPILFHKFAALFPLHLVEGRSYVPNLVLWIVSSVGAAIYAMYVGEDLLHEDGFLVALVFLGFYLTLVSNIATEMNGLNYLQLSERLMARLACSYYFCAMTVWLVFHDMVSLIVAVCAGCVVCISSMFGRQAIVFVSSLVALIMFDVRPLGLLALGVLGSLVVDRGYFIRGLRHFRQASQVYNRYTKHSRYYRLGLSKYLNWRHVLQRGQTFTQRFTELEKHEPSRVIFSYPETVLLIVTWVSHGDLGPMTLPLVALMAATFVVYLATSTSPLRHFGEANRYIEYTLSLIAPLVLAALAVDGAVYAPILAFYFVWILGITIKKCLDWRRLIFPTSDLLREFTDRVGLGEGHTVFSVPFTLGSAVCVRARCRAIMYQGSEFTLAQYTKFFEEIPYLKRDWKPLASEFDVTHIVAEKSHLSILKDLVGWEYDFFDMVVVAETDRYIAFLAPANTAL